MIDTHCHLTFRDFAGRVPDVLAEADGRGVTGCITISTTTRDCLEALLVAEVNERVWCSAGVHPLHADEGPHEWQNLRTVAEHEKCVAWGELGLDNHYDKPESGVQHAVLAEQLAFIEACNDELDLPVVVHCRKAFDDLLPILSRSRLDPARFVFHCFTGDADDARKVLDFGAMISFTGVVTYRNAPEVREAAKIVPPDRIMVETDAPFLSPEPHRGTRPCRPAFVWDTATRLATLRGADFDEFHSILNANSARFFGIYAR
jgi:TatD DNase family protein